MKEPENLDDSRLLTPQSDEDIVTSPVETNKPQYNRIALPPSIAPSSNMIDDDLEEETIQTVSNFSVQCDSDDGKLIATHVSNIRRNVRATCPSGRSRYSQNF